MSSNSKQSEILLNCPHCQGYISILQKEINCGIFRHGIIKATNKQMNPHEVKEECIRLFDNELIYGCGKPFRLLKKDEYIAEICEYI